MAAISFGNKAELVWVGAGWALRQVVRDLSQMSSDFRFQSALNAAEQLGFLNVEADIDPQVRLQMMDSIERLCRGVLDYTVPTSVQSFHPDLETQGLYRKELQELLSVVESARLNGAR